MSLLKLVAVSKTRVVAAGGSVGISVGGTLVESNDGGTTWTQTELRGHGYVFGLDLFADGSAGFAVTCTIGGLKGCGVWSYQAS